MSALKTIKQDESIARSRFVDCPVCKNHTLKLKRTVQVGRCKNCSETYKVIVVFVKTGRKSKTPSLTASPTETRGRPETASDSKQTIPDTSSPSWQVPSDSSLFAGDADKYSGLSEAIFGESHKDEPSETSSSSGQ